MHTKQGREDARKRNSTTGELLYHNHDFYYDAPFHVIEALVKAYPEEIVDPTYSRKRFPYLIDIVVYSAWKETRNKVFKLFFETNPKCLDNCAFGLFHHAFQQCDLEVSELLIQTNPNFLYQNDPNITKYGLPIHLSCSKVRCKQIDVLLAFDPSHARMVKEDSKMLPLHLACMPAIQIFDIETFRRLIEAYPQAAKEKDSKGRLPLHYACDDTYVRPNKPGLVSELLKIYPEAVRIRGKNKNLPVHYMKKAIYPGCTRVVEKQLVALIETYHDSLLQIDGDNQLVLDTFAEF